MKPAKEWEISCLQILATPVTNMQVTAPNEENQSLLRVYRPTIQTL